VIQVLHAAGYQRRLMKRYLPLSVPLYPDRTSNGHAPRRSRVPLTANAIGREGDCRRQLANTELFHRRYAPGAWRLITARASALLKMRPLPANSMKSSAMSSEASSPQRTSGSINLFSSSSRVCVSEAITYRFSAHACEADGLLSLKRGKRVARRRAVHAEPEASNQPGARSQRCL
jgi:hypothetical protein